MGALAEVKQEWKHFRDDEPGERFCNHRKRMMHKPRGHSMIALGVGLVLLAGGVVLLFMPGPGLPLIVFGLALVGSHSKRLSGLLDRTEPKLRRLGHRSVRKWKSMPGRVKLGLILALAALAAAASLAMWKYVVAAYLLG
ncbi:MAG TPA: PGPGW domain-containing protein [Kofleriaceae bacterium]